MNMLRPQLGLAALTLAALFSLQARADILLTATDGIHTGSADDHLTPGLATFAGAVGNFNVSIDVGAGFPQIGAPTDPILDLTSLDLTTGAGGGTLTVSLTETGFATTTAAQDFLSSIVGNYVGSHAAMSSYLDTSNAHFGTGTPLASGLLDNQAAITSVPPVAGPYSLTEVITVTAGAESLTSLDAIIVDAPEPGTLSLLVAWLIGLAMLGWQLRLPVRA